MIFRDGLAAGVQTRGFFPQLNKNVKERFQIFRNWQRIQRNGDSIPSHQRSAPVETNEIVCHDLPELRGNLCLNFYLGRSDAAQQ